MKKVGHKRIPNCLRKYRKMSGYTQREVARILGLRNAGMISRWEKGRRMPAPFNMFRLAALYRTMVDALFIDLVRAARRELQANINEDICA